MKLTENTAIEIIDSVANGDSLKGTLEKHGVNPATFQRFMTENPSLENSYMRAQQIRAEIFVDEIVHIADNEPDPNKARVRTDARKWYASKMQPQKYGDRLDLNVNQTVDIGSALAEARKRALPSSFQSSESIEQVIDVTPKQDVVDTGSQSVDANKTSVDDIFD